MAKGDKKLYFEKVRELCSSHSKILLANIDNVSSIQMHQIRHSIRGKATILMGKNTLIRKAFRETVEEIPALEAFIPNIIGNVGLIFTNEDLKEIRDIVTSNKVASPAKAGYTVNEDIIIPAGQTTMQPTETAFLQGLGISTKVNKGMIEILKEFTLLNAGEKCGPTEVDLCNKMKMLPFSYGMSITSVYDNGAIFDAAMLDITDDVLIGYLKSAIKNVACVSLATKIPTVASVPHLLVDAFKKVVSVGLATEYSFPEAEKLKNALANAASAPVAAAGDNKTAAAVEEVAEEAEESDEDMGFGLFD